METVDEKNGSGEEGKNKLGMWCSNIKKCNLYINKKKKKPRME